MWPWARSSARISAGSKRRAEAPRGRRRTSPSVRQPRRASIGAWACTALSVCSGSASSSGPMGCDRPSLTPPRARGQGGQAGRRPGDAGQAQARLLRAAPDTLVQRRCAAEKASGCRRLRRRRPSSSRATRGENCKAHQARACCRACSPSIACLINARRRAEQGEPMHGRAPREGRRQAGAPRIRGVSTRSRSVGMAFSFSRPSNTGPRRFRICSCSSHSQALAAMRSGAADDWPCTCSGRKMKIGASVASAWLCSRRICSGRACGSQASTAAAALDLIACSAAQSCCCGVCGADPDQVLRRQAAGLQAGQVRRQRRVDQQQGLACTGAGPARWGRRPRDRLGQQPAQRRRQQPPFEQRLPRQQDLAQRPRGPAAAGQFGIQRGKAAGHAGAGAGAQAAGAPDLRMQVFQRGGRGRIGGEGSHGQNTVVAYSIGIEARDASMPVPPTGRARDFSPPRSPTSAPGTPPARRPRIRGRCPTA